MEVRVAHVSEVGKVRQHNEDSFGINEQTLNGKLYVVCDGMGGHVGGARASSIAVNSILEYFNRKVYENVMIEMDKAIQFANEQIYAETTAEPSLKGMGTTAVVLLINGEECYIGHVGDSRIYLKTAEGKLHRITKDHSYVQQLVDKNIITDDEAERHPQKNQILKALGHAPVIEAKVPPKPIMVKNGDTFMLCSDGLNGMINDSIINNDINPDNLKESAIKLYNDAMDNGGHDNISLILVNVVSTSNKGPRVFIDENPKERLDQTSTFSNASSSPGRLPDKERPVKQKYKWMLFAGIGAVCILGLATWFFLGKNKSKNEGSVTDNTTTNTEPASVTMSLLQNMTYSEIEALKLNATKLDNSIINGKYSIQTKDGHSVELTIKSNLVIELKKNVTSNNPSDVTSNTNQGNNNVNSSLEIQNNNPTKTAKQADPKISKYPIADSIWTLIKKQPEKIKLVNYNSQTGLFSIYISKKQKISEFINYVKVTIPELKNASGLSEEVIQNYNDNCIDKSIDDKNVKSKEMLKNNIKIKFPY